MLAIHDHVHKGERPSLSRVDAAPGAPRDWVPLMRQAWSQEPDRRPEFRHLQDRLSTLSLLSGPAEGGDWETHADASMAMVAIPTMGSGGIVESYETTVAPVLARV